MKFIYWSIALCALLIACDSQPQGTAEALQIIPQPVSVKTTNGTFTINADTKIQTNKPELKDVAAYFAENVRIANISESVEATKNTISFLIDESISSNTEAYKLVVTKNEIKVTGASARGVLMGTQSLLQLLPADFKSATTYTFPCVEITDEPRFSYRGIMLDVSRHFFTKAEVKRLMDLMSFYKFNKLHMHLTDDQGWRIEIKKYPELTKSGYRKFNSQDRECIRLAKSKDNPDFELNPELIKVNEQGDTVYGGFYTQDDIRELVQYAATKGIDILPEFDMPGHFMAVLDLHPQLSCFNKIGWGDIFSTPVCPGKDEVITFCEDVLSELFTLFPYQYIHIGGDEVDKTNWKKCPHCQKRMKAENCKNEEELQSWFIHRIEKFINANGKKMVGWDEIIEGGLSPTATIMYWRTWAKDAVQHATSTGNSVIQTPNAVFYLDYAQNEKSLETLYETNPIGADLSAEQAKLIMGAQGNLWAEWVSSEARMQYMIIPRLFAISELNWSKPENKNWDSFEARLPKAFAYMDAMGINYRTPDLGNLLPINVFVGETTVDVKKFLDNTTVRYTTDGSTPNENSTLYTESFKISETTKFKFRTFKPNGRKDDVTEAVYDKQEYSTAVTLDNPKAGINANWHLTAVNRCADIEKAPVHKSYTLNKIEIPADASGKIGMVYTGFIKVPAEGIYTLVLVSDDGSVFTIGDKLVVDHDGPHGPSERRGQVALGAGWHPFKLMYFDSNGGILNVQLFDAQGNELVLNESTLAQ